jgi:hypothetical protein
VQTSMLLCHWNKVLKVSGLDFECAVKFWVRAHWAGSGPAGSGLGPLGRTRLGFTKFGLTEFDLKRVSEI